MKNAFNDQVRQNSHTHGINLFKLHLFSLYLFELDHDVFGQLHVLKHPLKLTGECCSAFCNHIQILSYILQTGQ